MKCVRNPGFITPCLGSAPFLGAGIVPWGRLVGKCRDQNNRRQLARRAFLPFGGERDNGEDGGGVCSSAPFSSIGLARLPRLGLPQDS